MLGFAWAALVAALLAQLCLSSPNLFMVKDEGKRGSASLLSKPRTYIVPLAEEAGLRATRQRRDANSTVPKEDLSQLHSSDEARGSPIGQTPPDPLLHELENSVDITDKKIATNLKEHRDFNGQEAFGSENDTQNEKYYKQEFKWENFDQFYQDLQNMNVSGPHKGKVKEHSMLSQSYRRAATINLSFKFPFYGHEVENITIATGGFLYTGEYVHSWLAATQYIAPLMANFDTSNNHHAAIRYLDDGEKLVVEWKDVYLQEREAEGLFTFQVTLHKRGDIWFAYRTIPIEIVAIKDEDHPVKVGLSDAYIIDRTIYFARRKTIYEYHRLNMKNKNIRNQTAIVFQALETCNMKKDCQSCLTADENTTTSLACSWCPELGRCSDGTDRNRQDWLKKKCDVHNVSSVDVCPGPGQDYPSYHGHQESNFLPEQIGHEDHIARIAEHESQAGTTATALAVGFAFVLLIALLAWVQYAYNSPNTPSGRFLIKYRPHGGAWRWRQSGARYTAASIHM